MQGPYILVATPGTCIRAKFRKQDDGGCLWCLPRAYPVRGFIAGTELTVDVSLSQSQDQANAFVADPPPTMTLAALRASSSLRSDSLQYVS